MTIVLVGQSKKRRRDVLNSREQKRSAPTSLELRNVETLVGWIIFLRLHDIMFSYNGYKLCIFSKWLKSDSLVIYLNRYHKFSRLNMLWFICKFWFILLTLLYITEFTSYSTCIINSKYWKNLLICKEIRLI